MKNILIAGGTDGIGLSFLKSILNEPNYNQIYVLGRNFDKITDIKNDKIIEIECDITDSRSINDSLKIIDSELDLFINTIGTFNKKPISEITDDEIKNHFELNTIANINLTRAILQKLNPEFAQILVCLATLAINPREHYALQSSTKVAYKFFLDVLRKEQGENIRIMTIMPPSVKTNVFAKAGDNRDVSNYADPKVVAEAMQFMLNQPKEVEIKELILENR